MGWVLAEREDYDADMVIPVPDSGIYAALDFQKNQKFLLNWE